MKPRKQKIAPEPGRDKVASKRRATKYDWREFDALTDAEIL
jgi:putative transcriptional regulator